MSTEKANASVKVSKGDIIRLEFDGWIVESGELFDTTDAGRAKEAGIFNENLTYAPIPILLGNGRIFEGLEEAIIDAEVGVEREVVIPPEKAAGHRDPKLVEIHPIREFLKQNIEPKVGMEISMKNRVGTIISVTTGRVRIDFNKRLAGKTLKYRFKVVSKIEDPEEKVKAILEMDYGTSDGFRVTLEDKKAIIFLPDVCKYDQKWLISKYRVVSDLRDALGFNIVQFVEEYVKKEEESKVEEKKGEEKGNEPLQALEKSEASQ
ncbi:MAG: peptidylprolyl isomerase [Methanomassiliicoccales archaeon]|jgi:FKBP-type peptidyl-prolyl cis-trans isomerase 2|nr:peptidylprolyl isomerase [Methanomassiliicoccales archaeon]